MDSHSKSLAKAFSWRIIATVTTGLIGLIITGSVKVASAIMTFDFVLKLLLYYLDVVTLFFFFVFPVGRSVGASVRRAIGGVRRGG